MVSAITAQTTNTSSCEDKAMSDIIGKLYRGAAAMSALSLLALMLLGGASYAIAALIIGGLCYIIGIGYKAMSGISETLVKLGAVVSIFIVAIVGLIIQVGIA